MKKILLSLTITFSIALLSQGVHKKEVHESSHTKNIIITEKTFLQLTDPSRNHLKLAKIADKKNKIQHIKDDPFLRIQFEEMMLRNPKSGIIPKNIRKRELQFIQDNAANLKSTLKASQLVWNRRGPFNVGGRTRALALDITNENIILAGGVTGGMWRSTDNGETWTKTSAALDHQSVTAIAQDPRGGQTNVWYYTTGEFIGSGSASGAFYSGEGVFKSIDGGLNWNKLNFTDQQQTPLFTERFDVGWNICINPTNGYVYVATYGGIYRSTDQGNNWTLVLDSNPNNNSQWSPLTDIHCTSEGVMYASLSSGGEVNGIFRSTSGDINSWTNITPQNFPASFRRIVITTSPTNTKVAYFLAQTPGSGFQGHSLWKLTFNSSEDQIWENRSNNLPPRGEGERDVNGYDSQNSYNMVIKVAPKNENVLFIGGTNLFRSDDAFSTNTRTKWIGGYATSNDVSEYPNQHPDQHAMVFKSNNQTLICGHDGGICITNNFSSSETDETPVNWTKLNNGYLTTQAYTVAIDEKDSQSDEILAGFQDNGTYYTDQETNTASWIQVGSGDGGHASLHNSKNSYLVSSQSGITFLQISDESGQKWTRVDPQGAENLLFINPFTIDANNDEIMYFAGGQFLWRNLNIYEIPLFSNEAATQNWEKLEFTQVEGQISALESTSIPQNILYYGTSNGEIFKLENTNTSQPIKTNITGNLMPSGAYVSSIESDPEDASKVMVTFSNYEVPSIFYSQDGGQSWTMVAGNLEENSDGSGNGPSVRYINSVQSSENTIYLVGTSTGLYSATTLSNTTQWKQESPDKIGNSITNMVKTRRDGLIIAGTHGNGIFSSHASKAVGIENPLAEKEENEFLIFPNPMIKQTEVKFSNPNQSTYRLIVVDANGKVVRIINNITGNNILINRDQLKPGIHIINLEGEKIYRGKILVK
jgi:photosystem II stability/assembly factor-like uncharacterized protein